MKTPTAVPERRSTLSTFSIPTVLWKMFEGKAGASGHGFVMSSDVMRLLFQ